MYLINKYKPSLNVESKSVDELSIELPTINFTKLYPVRKTYNEQTGVRLYSGDFEFEFFLKSLKKHLLSL